VKDFKAMGAEVGELVASKQVAYGDSAGKSGAILAALYPDGIPPHAYDTALLVVRVLDKLCRLAQRGADGLDRGGESPWRDVAGYALLGLAQDDARARRP